MSNLAIAVAVIGFPNQSPQGDSSISCSAVEESGHDGHVKRLAADTHPRRYVSVMGRNVLVVSTVEHADDVLRVHVGDADTIKVVVPVVRQGALDWLASDQKAFGHAERVADHTAEQLPGETVDAVAGEANVGLAVRDALATFPADEIVVALRPDEEKGVVELMATEGAPQHSVEGVPVRYVVVPD